MGALLLPLLLFKMMFISYIYGIRSERQLEREIRTNVAYRWFLGLKFKNPVRGLKNEVNRHFLLQPVKIWKKLQHT
jgi:transposase